MAIFTVVETPEFDRRAATIMTDDERAEVIDSVARNPLAGVPIGGGIRKVRIGRKGGGKSKGYRIVYFFGGDDNIPVFLITAFAKNEKLNLSQAETNIIKKLGKKLAEEYRGRQ